MNKEQLEESAAILNNHFFLPMEKEEAEDEHLEEADTTWDYYNNGNPALLHAIQTVLNGSEIDDAVDSLVEKSIGMKPIGALGLLGAGAAAGSVATKAYAGAKRRRRMKQLAKTRWQREKARKAASEKGTNESELEADETI